MKAWILIFSLIGIWSLNHFHLFVVVDQMEHSPIWLIFNFRRKWSCKYVTSVEIFYFLFNCFCVLGLICGTFVFLKLVVLYVDFKLDESYTPSKISIRAGDGFHNLKVFCWILFTLFCFCNWQSFSWWLIFVWSKLCFRRLRLWNLWSQLGGFIFPYLEMIPGKHCYYISAYVMIVLILFA